MDNYFENKNLSNGLKAAFGYIDRARAELSIQQDFLDMSPTDLDRVLTLAERMQDEDIRHANRMTSLSLSFIVCLWCGILGFALAMCNYETAGTVLFCVAMVKLSTMLEL